MTSRRISEFSRLSEALRRAETGLTICCISGPGGVGKTFLIDEVLASERPVDLGYLPLAVAASNPQTRGDFFGLIEGQLAAPALPPPARPRYDYFPELRKVAALHRGLVEAATAELEAQGAPADVKKAAVALLRAAHLLNEVVPKSKSYINAARIGADADATEQVLDAAWDTIGKLRALRPSSWLPGPMRDVLGINRKNRVRRDLFNVTADALMTDVTAAISGYARGDALKVTQARIDGMSRLLVVFDDYEALAPILGDFLVGSLVPRLASAPFPTTLIFGCRDDLEATHAGWAQHAKRWLREHIRLAPFSRDTAFDLMAEAEIPEGRRDAMFESTRGFPFLLALAIEEATSTDGASALFAKKFFDRTTRWMTPQQRDWFTTVCYLDDVNEDQLSGLVDPSDVQRVQDWFESEASVRDPDSPTFRVRHLIRERALRYLETRSPSRHREMIAKAARCASARSAENAGPSSAPVGSAEQAAAADRPAAGS